MADRSYVAFMSAEGRYHADAERGPHCMDEDLRSLDRFLATRDEADFRQMYRRFTPQMFSLAMRLSAGRTQDAEDAVQEAWSRACRLLPRFRRESKFSTWLCGIVVNCFREQRKVERFQVADVAETAAPPTRDLQLEQLLWRLPEGCREVLVLHEIEGYTHQEISGLLGIAEGTSKHQLFRARQLLKEWLASS